MRCSRRCTSSRSPTSSPRSSRRSTPDAPIVVLRECPRTCTGARPLARRDAAATADGSAIAVLSARGWHRDGRHQHRRPPRPAGSGAVILVDLHLYLGDVHHARHPTEPASCGSCCGSVADERMRKPRRCTVAASGCWARWRRNRGPRECRTGRVPDRASQGTLRARHPGRSLITEVSLAAASPRATPRLTEELAARAGRSVAAMQSRNSIRTDPCTGGPQSGL